MAAPTISSRTPAINATNVYLNQLIYITFDQAMSSASFTDNTLILYRTSDYAIIDKTISYDSDTYKVTITPDVIFDENATYNMVAVGLDQSSTCIKNSSAESLVATATWYFTTGIEVYEAPEDTVTETQPEAPVADTPVAKVLEPSASTTFSITATDPENYESDIGTLNSNLTTATWSGPITITFNRLLASGSAISQDWISLSGDAVDGDPAITSTLPSGALSNDSGKILTYAIPTYQSNNALWYANNEITVTISEDVEDYEGNALGDNYQFMFTTPYRPLYCTIKKIRAVIGPFIRDINDDVINRNIYLNSVEAYNVANTIYNQTSWDDMDSPTFAAKMYVCCKTQYDLLYAKLLDISSTGGGQMKRLGDFTLQDGTDLREGIKGAIQKALYCANAWFKQLLGKHRRAKTKMVVKGVSSPVTPLMRGVRTWSAPGESEKPGSNKRAERHIKSPGLYDEWS